MSDEKRVKKLNTKKKFVSDGVFNAELNAFLTRALSQEGYAGIEVRATSVATEIRIYVAKDKDLLEKGARRVREIQSLIKKRYGFNDEDNKVDLTIRPTQTDKDLCSAANIENLKYKLLNGTPVRMAVNNIMNSVMRRNAIGITIIVSGKVRGQRAKAQKYTAGYLISTGHPKKEFVDTATRHVNMRQGVLGLKVMIMASLEKKKGKQTIVMPDFVKIHDPKDEQVPEAPTVVFPNRE
uniref:40S ribosomal protein S3 n=1 Tax=Strombidium inclinatum TaxID=197538 RepID=A0A7S3MVS3_9SPIT|mmetsp:Transcript_18682/g.28602  ORF Transcript_18682/g.28602 Transcript_18682/m.28602 type:complete len:238 (+) Transcript_18682:38-751(+)|eukprot:CAMPEP_0170490778 /NCGR_PEP_ID=MMETSP0208-20121228/9276_1 /TAXON_ID=197538 /ORGANISM="Strombidium inclinatum, Strain S3" /LENGTH=237 /DNA_ID=CAMNT_0010766223 /DNA_START=16 /DNA_END=729 /DNA_ORIENTATION=+